MSLVMAIVIAVTGGQVTAWASGNASEKNGQFASNEPGLDAENKSGGGDSFTRCTEPRPQICTREYRPVCAQTRNGSFKTYATGCTACSDSDVAGYVDGACE